MIISTTGNGTSYDGLLLLRTMHGFGFVQREECASICFSLLINRMVEYSYGFVENLIHNQSAQILWKTANRIHC